MTGEPPSPAGGHPPRRQQYCHASTSVIVVRLIVIITIIITIIILNASSWGGVKARMKPFGLRPSGFESSPRDPNNFTKPRGPRGTSHKRGGPNGCRWIPAEPK